AGRAPRSPLPSKIHSLDDIPPLFLVLVGESATNQTSRVQLERRLTTSIVRVDLAEAAVTDGQGGGEGNFEVRIHVLEWMQGNLTELVWPSLSTTEEINKARLIDKAELQTSALSRLIMTPDYASPE